MHICGLNKTTLLDYPGHVAATVFTGGCNFRCPFCHNADLVLHSGEQPIISAEEIFRFLAKRRGILEGICITGGEPTLQEDLEAFICQVKNLDYLVKLDTNGSEPKVLEALLNKGVLDYVAMDIKNTKDKYADTIGQKGFLIETVEESIRLIQNSTIPYEFRTTVVRELHQAEDFEELGDWLNGSRAYYLQAYRDDEHVIHKGFTSYSREELESFASRLKPKIKQVGIRGVE